MLLHVSFFSRRKDAPSVTRIWLRYYLTQLFGDRWRKTGRGHRPRRMTFDRQKGLRLYDGAADADPNGETFECQDI